MAIINDTVYNGKEERLHCQPADEYKYNIYTVIYSLVFSIGLTSNLIALYVFCKVVKKKKVVTVCLMNLAAADLLFLMTLPFRISYYSTGANWKFGDVLCRLSVFAFYFSMYASIFFLTLLSIFRYMALVRPHVVTVKRATVIIVIVWIVTSGSNAPFILSGSFVRENVTRCFEPSGLSSWTRIMYMNYVALIFGFLLPFVTILICNGMLIKHIRKQGMTKTQVKKHVTMIVLVLLVFCVCFLPYHVQRTVHLHFLVHHHTSCGLHLVLQKTVVATLCLAVTNSCLDPLLYVFLGQGFKSWFRLFTKTKKQSTNSNSSAQNGEPRMNSVTDWDVEMTSLSLEEKRDEFPSDASTPLANVTAGGQR